MVEDVRCERCQAVHRAGVRFCEDCGAALRRTCGQCGSEVVAGKRFCGACGATLATDIPASELPAMGAQASYTPSHLAERILNSRAALEGERKQVTVLFCDIVDSTALTQRVGAEAMHRVSSGFFEIGLSEVHRYEGTVTNFLGDGFMALLGAPLSHEDHARRAVLVALGLRRRLKEEAPERFGAEFESLRVRMGVNTGTVVVGTIGDDLRMDYTAIGDAINMAARLQALAGPGEILISESTARLVAGYLRLEKLGPCEVKGGSVPIITHRVLGPGARRSPLERLGHRRLSRFVGRKRPLAALRELLGRAQTGQGQAVGVVGEPGMGKSRLLHEFRRHLKEERVTYLEGRCLSYGRGTPFLPVLEILRANCAIGARETPEGIEEKLRFALQEVGMDDRECAPYLLHLLGVRTQAQSLAALSPEAIKARTFEALRQMWLSGSRRRPIITVVEDLHWLDSTSEEFFSSLANSLSGVPILLLATYRPGYRPPWMDLSYATQVALPHLDAADSLSVIQSVPGAEKLPAALAQVILERAEGNPFFLEELSRAVVEHGDGDPAAGVPDTVQGVLMARIDRLTEGPRHVLQTASVLGREFPLPLLGAIWDGQYPLEPQLLELRRQEFIYERPGASEPILVFKHALTQDVAYQSLLTGRRQALHEAAGRALEGTYAGQLEEVYDRLAHHYSKTEQSGKAVDYLSRFAAASFRTYAHVEASSALTEALRHAERLSGVERDRRIVELTLQLVNSLYFLGELEKSRDLLLAQRARVEGLGDRTLSGAHHFWLAHTFSHLGDPEGAVRLARRAIDEAEACGDEAALGRALYVLAREDFWAGRFEEGLQHCEEAVPLLRAAGDHWFLGHCICYIARNLQGQGHFEQALAAAGEARAVGEAIGDPRIQSFAAWNRGHYHAARGDIEAAIGECARALELSPDEPNTAWATGVLGFAQREAGALDAAIEHLERALEGARQTKHRRVESWFGGWLSEAYLRSGQLARAREVALYAAGTGGEVNCRWGSAYAERVLGRIALAEGGPTDAQGHLDEALRIYAEVGAHFDAALTRLDLAECARDRGRRQEAEKLAAAARAALVSLGVEPSLVSAGARGGAMEPLPPAAGGSSLRLR